MFEMWEDALAKRRILRNYLPSLTASARNNISTKCPPELELELNRARMHLGFSASLSRSDAVREEWQRLQGSA